MDVTTQVGSVRKLMRTQDDLEYQHSSSSSFTQSTTTTAAAKKRYEKQTEIQKKPSLGRSILLRGGKYVGNSQLENHYEKTHTSIGLVEVNETTSLALNNYYVQNHHRIVYLQGEDGSDMAESWRQFMTAAKQQRNFSIEIYPQLLSLPLLYEKQKYQQGNNSFSNDDNVESTDTDTLEDLTRYYPQIDSMDDTNNENVFHIERRQWPRHEIDPEHCVPAAPQWQSTSFPTCNRIHEKNMLQDIVSNQMDMVSKKGFWRRAWGTYDDGDEYANDVELDDLDGEVTTPMTTTQQQKRQLRQKLVWKTFK
jgi:hypothetical protein